VTAAHQAVTAAHRSVTAAHRSATSGATAVDLLREALRRVAHSIELQMVATMVGQTFFERLGALAAAAGRPERALELASGYGDLEEARMISALHAVAHRGAPLSDFLARYGARCPGENELSAFSWRERPELVRTLVAKYRDAPDRADPVVSAEIRAEARRRVEREVLDGLPAHRRPGARVLMRLARTYIPLREEGKSAMAMAMDTARCAARRRGRELAGTGVLDDPEDVFMLTLDELAEPPAEARELVTRRTELRAAYQRLELPTYWLGDPEPVAAAEAPARRVDRVTGIPASAGVVEGRARVMTDAEGIDDLLDGEILVCRTTDPSWGAAFHLVSAAVIDIGGPASHGAIVSRELGMPCVINTGNGTSALRTGDLLRVDGRAGVVTVLEPAVES
jgi:pyruvate,water dikinase